MEYGRHDLKSSVTQLTMPADLLSFQFSVFPSWQKSWSFFHLAIRVLYIDSSSVGRIHCFSMTAQNIRITDVSNTRQYFHSLNRSVWWRRTLSKIIQTVYIFFNHLATISKKIHLYRFYENEAATFVSFCHEEKMFQVYLFLLYL